MPRYPWLITGKSSELDKSQTEAKMKAMASLGVPYSDEQIANAQQSMDEQGAQIESTLFISFCTNQTFEETGGGAFKPRGSSLPPPPR